MYKVLIVDDEPLILEGLPNLINWEEHNLEIAGQASNGLEALEIIKSIDIDILITDIRMPKTDGLELLTLTKEMKKNVKFIVLSGYNDFEYVKAAAKLGIENYLLKPVDDKELTLTLVDTVNKIERELSKNIEIKEGLSVLRDNILYMWVTGSLSYTELKDKAAFLNINLESRSFTVAIFKIMNPQTDKTFKGRDIKSSIQNIFHDTFKESYTTIPFYYLNDEMIIIFMGDNLSERTDAIEALMYNCIKKTNDQLNIDAFITVGSFENDFSELYLSYNQAKKMQDFSLILGSNKVLCYDYAPKPRIKDKFDFENYLVKISSSIKNRNSQALCVTVDAIFDELFSIGSITPDHVLNVIFELFYTIIDAARSVNQTIDFSLNATTSLLVDINNLKTIDQVKRWFYSVADLTINLMKDERKKYSTLIAKVIDYINLNYSQSINLKTIASKFDSNAFYLGQLFKKETGKSFTDYINCIRIEKAKELLLTMNLKTSEVASRVGYVNTNYFFTIFKKNTGISPAEFRGE